jgi:hypothetical protein
MRRPIKPAWRQTAAHGFFRSDLGRSGSSPGITNGPRRGCVCRTVAAARLRTMVFRPVLESGNSNKPRSRSTCSQRRFEDFAETRAGEDQEAQRRSGVRGKQCSLVLRFGQMLGPGLGCFRRPGNSRRLSKPDHDAQPLDFHRAEESFSALLRELLDLTSRIAVLRDQALLLSEPFCRCARFSATERSSPPSWSIRLGHLP